VGWRECLSGILGSTGATPIRTSALTGRRWPTSSRRAGVDRSTLPSASCLLECDFSYRTSLFRAEPGRFVVLAATLRLRPGGAPTLRYPELVRALEVKGTSPSLADVRALVLDVRRGKSMVLDPGDSNRRSVGSFFTNPVLEQAQAETLIARAVRCGVVTTAEEVPRYAAADDRIKIPAAWLIESAGFAKGTRRGAVGISSRHTLALVHHGGGSTAELLTLAADIRAAVSQRFGVLLQPEPAFLGFPPGDPLGPPAGRQWRGR
jgi:UDP-N-acetylmuramate dehydrogenase